MLDYLREIAGAHPLLRSLVARDLHVRYKRSVLGIAWAFVEPLALMVLFTIVFSRVLRLDVPNYPVFVLCGVIVWSFFATGVTHSLTSVSGNAALVKKLYFPRATLPLATVFGRFVHLLLSLLLLLPFLLWFRITPPWTVVFLPLLLLAQLLLVAGLALLFSALSTLYDDVSFIVTFGFMGLFYVSPVLYPLDMVPAPLRAWYALNPMSGLLAAYRAVLLGGPPPTAQELTVSVVLALAFFVAGTTVFRRLEWRFAEVL